MNSILTASPAQMSLRGWYHAASKISMPENQIGCPYIDYKMTSVSLEYYRIGRQREHWFQQKMSGIAGPNNKGNHASNHGLLRPRDIEEDRCRHRTGHAKYSEFNQILYTYTSCICHCSQSGNLRNVKTTQSINLVKESLDTRG